MKHFEEDLKWSCKQDTEAEIFALAFATAAKLDKARQALEYLKSPTMGFDGSCSAEEFAEKHATDENVRAALVVCIRTAQQAVDELDGGE